MDDFLRGAIDCHIHIGPDDSPRYSDSISLAKEAAQRGMAALVVKDHLSSSAQKAVLTSMVVPEIKVYGGIALNHTVGGLNPRSVVSCLKTGGKYVWMPTVDAAYCLEKSAQGHWIKEYIHKKSFGYKVPGISLLQEGSASRLKTEAREILRIAKDYGAVVSSGHVSPQECLALADEAVKIGFDRLAICHPNAWLEDFTVEVLDQLVAAGCFLELSFGACSPLHGRQDPHEIAAIIKRVGAAHCVMITDYGQVETPSPVEGMRVFCELMLRCGVPREDIYVMTRDNPRFLLGLG
ncbi:MAG TPA: hypothetical protein GXX30_07650 [Firmicutes bacterium]|nr:hypothetical protein [Candidatus Fermentithermobacillaceae bacterium]